MDHEGRAIRVQAAAFFVAALLVRGVYVAARGWTIAPDAASYMATCARWVEDPGALVRAHVGLETSGFTLPFCAWTEWIGLPLWSWIGLQVVLSAGAVGLMFLAVRALAGPRAGVVAGTGILFLWETFQWDAYILTDPLFVFSLALSFWAYAAAARGSAWARKGLWASLLWMALSRPVGPFFALAILSASEWSRRRDGAPRIATVRVVIVASLLLLSYSALSGRADTYVGEGDFLVRAWSEGAVVWDDERWTRDVDPEPANGTLSFALANPQIVAELGLARIVALHAPFSGRFSIAHNVLNVSVAVAFLLAMLALRPSPRDRPGARAPFLAVWAATTALVSITFVDFDWRYRAPLMLAVVSLAAIEISRHDGLFRAAEAQARRLLGPGRARFTRPSRAELRARARGAPSAETDESAIPSYAHVWWIVRELFFARLDSSLDLLKLRPGERLVDVGSGAGILADEAGRLGALAVGVDLRPMPGRDRAHTPVRADSNALPFRTGSADAICATDVLEHVADVDAAVKEIDRVLRPGGRVVVSVPTESTPYRALRRVVGFSGEYHARVGSHVIQAFERAGYRRRGNVSLPRGVTLFEIVRLERGDPEGPR